MERSTRIKWWILGVLAGLWFVLTVGFAVFFVRAGVDTTRTFEIAKFEFLSVSAFGVLFSVLLSSFNSLEATQNVQSRIAFDRVENAFDYMSRWESDPLRSARDFTRAIRKEKDSLSAAQLRERITADKDLERSVTVMFNFFEDLELAIQAGRVDEPVLRKAFSPVFVDLYDRFRPWLDERKPPLVWDQAAALRKRWA